MAAKKKTKVAQNEKILLFCCIPIFCLCIYSWYIYERIKSQESAQQESYFFWNFFKRQSSNLDDKSKLSLVLNLVKDDIQSLYLYLLPWLCLLVPREITSIVAAAVIVTVTLFIYCYQGRASKSKKKAKEKRTNDGKTNTEKLGTKQKKGFLKSIWLFLTWPARSITSYFKSKSASSKTSPNYSDVASCRNCDNSLVRRSVRSGITFSWIVFLFIVLVFMISIPWEYVRLFQIEVAKRMAVMEKGVPRECYPDHMTISESIRYWLLLQLSWQHDPCEKYHKALLVDPLWEITPLMVISSVITRSLLHPIELFFSGIGKSFRHFFAEIPAPWQPLMLIVMVILFILITVMVCGYRISFPMLLKIEPKTPILGRIRSLIVDDSCANTQSRQQNVIERKRLKYDDDHVD